MEKERRSKKSRPPSTETPGEYASFAIEIAGLLEAARRQAEAARLQAEAARRQTEAENQRLRDELAALRRRHPD